MNMEASKKLVGLYRAIFLDMWVRRPCSTLRLRATDDVVLTLTVLIGALVIFAKLSDIFGRKLIISLSLFIFIVFSAACGASQSLEQLYDSSPYQRDILTESCV
jgi:hypothetical protein